VSARQGALICDRCYGRLRRTLEAIPDLVGHLRSIADPLKAQVYDRVLVQGSAPEVAPAPVAADLLDALHDIMQTIGAGQLVPGASADVAYDQALGAVSFLLEQYDVLVNDYDAVVDWWEVVMSPSRPDAPEFWTVARALGRWPMEDRRRWAKEPCPECGLRSVKITPPRHRKAHAWFACSSCGWRKNDEDDDGLWAAAFGQYAEPDGERSTDMAPTSLEPKDIDITAALKAGTEYVLAHAEQVERAGTLGPFAAFLVGALPALAEEFAGIADQIGSEIRHKYSNGVLIAGGAQLTAKAIRAAVQGTEALEVLQAAQSTEDESGAAA
jgi:predicted RNA-binding Zn-ribbon protein involved in translation (DUF1610 family)